MIFKKAYIRDLINSKIVNCILYFFKFKHNGKIIVKSMDGVGDILVRSALAEKIIEKYGRENVVFLMKENYVSLGKLLGYNVIGIPRKNEKNLFKRLKMFYKINRKYNPKQFFNIEFGNDSTIANIYAKERVGIFDNTPMVKSYNKYYTRSFEFSNSNEKILEKIREIGENILETSLTIEDVIPDLRKIFPVEKEEGIVIAVGSTARDRVCSPLRMKGYIEELTKVYPKEEIILVGNGELQNNYAKELIKLIPKVKIKNLVNQTTLEEVFRIVVNSKFFVGFESGLYNFCFVTRKKGIGLFRDITVPFAHEVPWIRVIGPRDEQIDDLKDEVYFDKRINNISVTDFRKAIEELQ